MTLRRDAAAALLRAAFIPCGGRGYSIRINKAILGRLGPQDAGGDFGPERNGPMAWRADILALADCSSADIDSLLN